MLKISTSQQKNWDLVMNYCNKLGHNNLEQVNQHLELFLQTFAETIGSPESSDIPVELELGLV